MPEKILVEIIGEQGIKERRKCKTDMHKVELSRGRGRGKKTWKPPFGKENILYYHVGFWPLKRLKRKLMIREGASSFMDFSNGEKLPPYTFNDMNEYANAKVIKNSGQTTQKIAVPLSLYVVSILTLVVVGGLFFYLYDKFR